MRWFYSKQEDYVPNICTDPQKSKYQLRVSPNTNFDKDSVGEQNVDMRYLLIKTNNVPILRDIKTKILSLQEEYDNSAEVNSFYLNGRRAWLDKATRVGLVNSLTMQKNAGITDTTLWLDKISINVNIEKALTLLAAIEMYAIKCYNNTHKHMAEINQLDSIEACLQYDITAGYPTILNIQIQ